MGKFTDECRQLLELVGGKENISAVTHCVTRMRFVLADPKIADVKAIEALPTTKETFTQAGQFQVIIGNEVSTYYNDFVAVAGIEGVSKEAAKDAAKSNQTRLQKLMSDLAEIFSRCVRHDDRRSADYRRGDPERNPHFTAGIRRGGLYNGGRR